MLFTSITDAKALAEGVQLSALCKRCPQLDEYITQLKTQVYLLVGKCLVDSSVSVT